MCTLNQRGEFAMNSFQWQVYCCCDNKMIIRVLVFHGERETVKIKEINDKVWTP